MPSPRLSLAPPSSPASALADETGGPGRESRRSSASGAPAPRMPTLKLRDVRRLDPGTAQLSPPLCLLKDGAILLSISRLGLRSTSSINCLIQHNRLFLLVPSLDDASAGVSHATGGAAAGRPEPDSAPAFSLPPSAVASESSRRERERLPGERWLPGEAAGSEMVRPRKSAASSPPSDA